MGCGAKGLPLDCGALAGLAVLVDWAFRSFLTSVVALARLVSVFSRLVRRIWRAFSSLTGAVFSEVLFGRRDWTRGLFMRRVMRWADARADSSFWASFTGCMCLRYARDNPRTELSESWFGGRIRDSCSCGAGRKLGSFIVCIAGIMAVRVGGA